jgi:phosphoglycolate phosphatase-like HAD superfamily hydrolase
MALAARIAVFDIDGVLLPSDGDAVAAYVGAFERCFGVGGIDQDWNSYRTRNDIGIAEEILATHFGRPARVGEIATLFETYLQSLERDLAANPNRPRPLAGMGEAVAALAEEGRTALALATSNVRRAARLRLTRAGLWPYFPYGGFAEDGVNKTAILGSVLQQFRGLRGGEISRGSVVFLGDQPSDLAAAGHHGVHFLGVAQDLQGRESLHRAGARQIVTDLADPAALIAQLEELWQGPAPRTDRT